MTSADRALIGTFRLIAAEHVDEHGAIGEPFGPDPIGYMTYTAEGYMFVVLSRGDRAQFAAGDILGGTVEERAAAFGDASAFVGRFRTEGNVVTYDLVAATYPNWVGTTQVRTFEFDGDRLVLTTPMLLMDGVQRRATLTLDRL